MKALLREIKKNPQETKSEGRENGIQINDLEHKEEINIQPEQKEETSIQKKRRLCKKTLGCLQMCQHLNPRGARRRRGRAGH